jgi:hypothetical protein
MAATVFLNVGEKCFAPTGWGDAVGFHPPMYLKSRVAARGRSLERRDSVWNGDMHDVTIPEKRQDPPPHSVHRILDRPRFGC